MIQHRLLGVVLGMALLSACQSSSNTEPAAEAEKPVELSAKGQTFDPPIRASQLPDGAWYCDMGTVHYARHDKGDGKCTLCKMDLKHKTAAK